MPFIDLDRHFVEWRKDTNVDPEWFAFYSLHGKLTWKDLLSRQRVVILAEAGSGKSEELKERARILTEEGKFAFYATVEAVGKDGLEDALSPSERAKLAEWRASDQPAWFFVDSVDEAKLDGVRLDTALRKVADGIANAETRSRIILSSRHTDWEYTRDLERLNYRLPIFKPQIAPAAPSPDEILIKTLHRRHKEVDPTPIEVPLVVLMAGLNTERIRLYAAAKGINDINAFIQALEKSDLKGMARRPLDLEWLVKFWLSKGRFEPYAVMLELCIQERIQEPDAQRARGDNLNQELIVKALERIGAALVFGGKRAITIPDSGATETLPEEAFSLTDILPEWSSTDCTKLRSRPIFDPATYGRTRFHNDNEGEIRSYLTAKWLLRRRQEGCPIETIKALLFAETHGIQTIKPSLRRTAAWLGLWDEDIAKEILERDSGLFLEVGDGESLPLSVKKQALIKQIELIVKSNMEGPSLSRNALLRFATPDLADQINQLWKQYSENADVRQLLLELIWLGSLKACADIPKQTVFGSYDDRYSRIFGGRALIATADDATKKQYAAHVLKNCGALQKTVVCDALEALFPTHFNVEDLVKILRSIDLSDRDGGLGYDWHGSTLVERLSSIKEVEEYIIGLIGLADENEANEEDYDEHLDSSISPALISAAQKALSLSPNTQVPTAAIDAFLKVKKIRRYGYSSSEDTRALHASLHITPSRRRTFFWHSVERFNAKQDQSVDDPWQLDIKGYLPDLRLEDIDWLIADVKERKQEEQQLALNTVMYVWQRNGRDPEVLSRIKLEFKENAELTATISNWTRLPNESKEIREGRQKIAKLERRNALQQAAIDKSWQDFAEKLRSNPDQLKQLPPPTEEGVDSRLYHIWRLLNEAAGNGSRYAVDDLSSLEPILGKPTVEAASHAFIKFWREWKPKLQSTRPAETRNSVSSLDCMGIVGISVEAHLNPNWADSLSEEEAELAVNYATHEINGFPKWISSLAKAKPEAVIKILSHEIDAEIATVTTRYDTLEDIRYGEDAVIKLMAPALLEVLNSRTNIPIEALASILSIIRKGLLENQQAFIDLAIGRFKASDILEEQVYYISSVFALDSAQALEALHDKLASLAPSEQSALVQFLFSNAFGDRVGRSTLDASKLPFIILEKLVLTAFEIIRVEDDNKRPGGVVYSPNSRDDAESARSALFSQLAKTPGRATFEAINRFLHVPNFPVAKKRLNELALERAANDSESAPWSPSEPHNFEKDYDSAPRTAADLQKIAIRRLQDIQHSLLHSDFAQGATLAGLTSEQAVQNWVADRLRTMQGRAYSVEREPHVAEEKEPDIRLRAKTTDASVAIEIKVAGSWTLEQLKEALTTQLCGKYLRERSAKHGILLLVYQEARPRGWEDGSGGFLNFEQVVSTLREMAVQIAASEPDAPQPEIVVIDVSSVKLPDSQE